MSPHTPNNHHFEFQWTECSVSLDPITGFLAQEQFKVRKLRESLEVDGTCPVVAADPAYL